MARFRQETLRQFEIGRRLLSANRSNANNAWNVNNNGNVNWNNAYNENRVAPIAQ